MTKPSRRLFMLLGDCKLLVVISCIAAILFVTGRTGISLLIGEFINNIFISQNYSSLQLQHVAILFAFGFLWSGAQYTMYLFSGKLAIRISHRLREQFYSKIIKLPMSYYHNNSGAELLSISSNDITLVESFLMNVMVQLLAQPLTVIVLVSSMFILNWKLSLYFLILGPTIVLLLGFIGSSIQKIGFNMQENIASLTKKITETIRHIQIIKGFNSEKIEIDQFHAKNKHQLSLADKEIKIRLLALPMSDFLGITAIILILSLGAVGIQMGIATAGDVTKFAAMAIILSEPISSFNQLILVVKKLGPSAERIFRIIDTPEEHDNHTLYFDKISGHIEFKDVSFAYHHQHQVLKNINLSIQAKETIAIIGYSGSGKSSLVSLIPKFYTPNTGSILIDGKNITEYNSASIRAHLSIVSQDTSLFSDTIYNNIKLSKNDATMEEIIEAAKTASAHEFITQHPDGYFRHVGDQGNNLSGGERQRIILTRAILRKPAILILDEPTSALDNESEQKITKALENIYGQQTTIIIAHKLPTVEKSDKIIVMKEGEIIEVGVHHQLIQQDTYYKKLYYSL
ncbi:MAG: ABC transporter ATP-binding protein [Brevinema sp.]